MLADCIRLAQTNNEALEALLQKFAPLIKKCGRQLHIEDGNEEMILAFIELFAHCATYSFSILIVCDFSVYFSA